MKWGKETPWELIKWGLIERFHWTPREVDALTLAELHEFIQVEDGRQNARGK